MTMNNQEKINYDRIATAIHYIRENFKEQPDLDDVAEKVHLSPFHFQRLFTEWAGVSPKKFLQYLSVDYSKRILKENAVTLFDAADKTGLSGTGRLHDLFVKIEGMTPGDYKNGGKALDIHYHFSETLFGTVLIASTNKGICHMAFTDDRIAALQELTSLFPNANLFEKEDAFQKEALGIFSQDWNNTATIKLHLRGTDFQLKVWDALLKIPMGQLSSYGKIAEAIGSPKASRAVGSAVGDNPIAFLIPCHRVIQASGTYGEYRWGSTRKKLLIGWEGAKRDLLNAAD